MQDYFAHKEQAKRRQMVKEYFTQRQKEAVIPGEVQQRAEAVQGMPEIPVGPKAPMEMTTPRPTPLNPAQIKETKRMRGIESVDDIFALVDRLNLAPEKAVEMATQFEEKRKPKFGVQEVEGELWGTRTTPEGVTTDKIGGPGKQFAPRAPVTDNNLGNFVGSDGQQYTKLQRPDNSIYYHPALPPGVAVRAPESKTGKGGLSNADKRYYETLIRTLTEKNLELGKNIKNVYGQYQSFEGGTGFLGTGLFPDPKAGGLRYTDSEGNLVKLRGDEAAAKTQEIEQAVKGAKDEIEENERLIEYYNSIIGGKFKARKYTEGAEAGLSKLGGEQKVGDKLPPINPGETKDQYIQRLKANGYTITQ